jgi:uncharacterized protein (DUF697 family)/predicted GTPase
MNPAEKLKQLLTSSPAIDYAQRTIGSLKLLPKSIAQWFRVDEAQVNSILEQVRASLPTTEVLLMGKPQSGKSSIIRSLTGATPDMIGQGFRPHTTHTQTYDYPTAELPLLTFIDTVGLGEAIDTKVSLNQELSGLLTSEKSVARIIILTVKITDFAIDYLHGLLRDIRKVHPQVPCLLVATCLHELYPPEQGDHPTYPPAVPDVQRAFARLQTDFGALIDRAVMVDFTLEGDGYEPVLYGMDAFTEALAELLPEAESRLIYQLLDQADAGDALESVYRQAGRRYILPFSIMAATLAAVPLPLATMPVLTALQVSMVSLLGRLYGQPLNLSQAGGVASAIAGGFLAQLIGRELIKFVPILGSVVAASWAGAYTWALGEGACVSFGDLMGGHKPDPKKIQATMQEAFQAAKERFRHSQ